MKKMQIAIAEEAIAERKRRALMKYGQGEIEVANSFVTAAEILSQHPNALGLRYLKSLNEISKEESNIIVPFPDDFFKEIMKRR